MEDTYADNMIGPCLQGDCDLVVIKDRSGTQDTEPWLYSIPKRKNKGPTEVHDTEDKCENTITIENGMPCDSLDMKGGHRNDAFMTEDERLTPL
ncbi:Collectrin [Manis pentadactyla]|nr:Collectrin [Manis pentadactyla]